MWLSRPPRPKSRDSGTGHLGHQNAAPTPHSRHPTRPGSCAAETTALGPTDWCPSGGAPRRRRPGRRRPKPSRFISRSTQPPSFHQAQGQTAPHARFKDPGCRVTKTKNKRSPGSSPDSRFVQILLASLDSSPPPWSPLVAWCPNLGSHSVWCDNVVLGSNGDALELHAARASSSPVRQGRECP